MSAQNTWFLHHSETSPNNSGDACSPNVMITPPSSSSSNHTTTTTNTTTIMDDENIHATKCTRYTHTILIYVNGIRYLIEHPNPEQTLGDYLRVNLQLTGTKIGCSEGGCGACVVMISHYDHQLNKIVNRSVNACLYPLIASDGCHIVTVEGVGTTRDDMLHLIQQRVAQFHASQCGFCTPGFVMSLYVLLRNNPHPTLEDVERSLDGNLCRCTGYRPILDAARSIIEEQSIKGCGKKDCCQLKNNNSTNNTNTTTVYDQLNNSSCSSNDCNNESHNHHSNSNNSNSNSNNNNIDNSIKSSDPLFPFELRSYKYKPLRCTSNIDSNRSIKWYRPITLEQFLEILQRYPKDDKRFIVGNTEIAIETRMKNKHFPIIIQPTHIKELLELSCIYDNDNNNENENENDINNINNNNDNTNTDNTNNSNEKSKSIKSLIIGSSITINNLEEFIKKQIKLLPSYQSQSLECILHQTKYFASTPIRNAACLAGNIITASPASDLNPLWVALDCNLKIMQMDGHVKTIPFKEFFTGYRQVQLKKSELLIHLEIPLPKQNNTIQLVKAFKQSKRREDDIAIVTSAMKIKLFKNNINNNLNENLNENINNNNNLNENNNNNKYYIQDVKLVYGGMNAYTISCEKTRQFLIGKELNDNLFKESIEYLIKDLPLAPNAPGGMIEYRKTLSLSFYYKFYLYILKELKIRNLDKEELSVLLNHHYIPRSFPKGEQFYNTIEINDSIGKSIQHQSSNIQVNGQAKYVDDIQPIYGQLYAALVQSTKPLAFIKSISYDKALQIKGVIGHVDYTDVKGHNRVGAVIPDDEELFISTKTTSIGQLIALIIAETPQQAKLASRLVVIEYDTNMTNINNNMNSNENINDNTIEKPIFTIESAIKNNSYLLKEKKIVSSPDINTSTNTTNNTSNTSNNTKVTASDILKELENDKTNYLIVSGDSYTNGAQEHFYIEPVSTIVIPNQPEIGEYLVYCTTQAPTHTQMTVSEVLNVPSHKVVTRVKRLGGGFGGKESKPTYFSAAIAVAAQKYQRPIKLTLDRDIDMSSTGQRHPYYVKYKVAININDFKLKAIEMELFANGGYSMDLSESVLNRALQCADNCYYIPYSTIIGRICKTNTLSNTAFRGFGGPQGCMAMELILDHLSYQLSLNILNLNNNINNNNLNNNLNNLQNNLELNNFIKLNNEISLKLRQVNFYTNENNITPYKMKIQDSNRIHLLWNETLKCSNYNERFKYIEEYNLNNRYRKRGLSIIPVKFGIAFGAPFLNQGGALIQIYFNDASVLLSIGGVCMGQGLFIKMIQCVSTTLGIPLEFIHISDTSTDKVPNTSATAASVSSDLYGQAVIKACQTLNNRLDSLKRKLFPHLYINNSNNNNNNSNNSSNNTSNNSYNYNLDNSIIKEDLNRIIENDLERLPPKLTHKEWKELISAAYFQGDVSLSATGYYSTSKDVWMDWNKGEGKPFNYFTYGCAASEVEIDTLTGDWSVIRSDIVMDLGNSLNPAIDIGQIEGAFIQGMGLYTMEEFIYGDENHEWFPQGYVFTRGPGAYKIPSANDIPLQFNIHLLDSNNNIININNNNTNNNGNTSNNNENNNENISSKINHKGTTATYGSKAVGEPPLFLGSSVYFAIKNAIKSARLDANLSQYFILDPPATTEKIRMACHDQFVSKFVNNSSNNDENTTNTDAEKNEPYLRIKGSY